VKQGPVLSAWPKANEADTGTSQMAVVCRGVDHHCRVKRHNIVITEGVGKVRANRVVQNRCQKNSVGLKEHDAKF
jgi:hypothetical protein